MADDNHGGGGIFGSVRRVADTCLSSVHNRVELLGLELQEEKIRLSRLILWTGAALFAAFLAITIGTLAIIMAFPAEQRRFVLIGFAVLYAIAAAMTALKLRSQVKNAPPPLADTMSELKKDLECLRSRE